ncbi:MAG: SDR family oxidoreductase [Pirellulaceae bacterium]
MSNAPRPSGKVSFDNAGRVVIVTGGASGIGLAVAQGFADSGADVIALDVVEPQQRDAADRVDYRTCDVTDVAAVASAIGGIVERYGAIDVLVNNAAIQPVASYQPLHELDPALLRRMLEVNVMGYNLVAQRVLAVMVEQQSGVIVNLASAHAHGTSRGAAGYGPTKAANMMQAKQWAIEYARLGIRVCSVSPGAIDTPLVRASLEQQGGEAQLANRHPLGRLGKPEEIAAAVMWLASPGASFVTATDLHVDGGLMGFASFADPYELPQ